MVPAVKFVETEAAFDGRGRKQSTKGSIIVIKKV